jgi:hypothetical protein
MTDIAGVDIGARRPMPPYATGARPGRARLFAVGGLLFFCFVYGAAFALFFPFFAIALATPIVLLGLVAVWALPDAGAAPTSLLEGLFFTFVCALVLWPNYLAVALPGLPWITVLRLTGLPMVVALLISVSISPAFRSRLASILSSTPWLWKLICAFIAIQTASIVLSISKGDSIDKFITAQTNWTTVFFVSCYVLAKKGAAELVAALLCLMAVVLSGVGLLEFHLGRVVWAGHVPSFLKVNDETVARILTGQVRALGAHRVQATFSTSLGFGEYLAMATPFLFYFATTRRHALVRLGALLAIPLIILLVILTQARVGAVGVTMVFFVYPFAWVFLRWRRNRSDYLAASAVYLSPALAAVGLVICYIVPGIRYRVLGGGADQASTQARMDQLHIGIPKILHNPLGYGIGQGANALGFRNWDGVLTIDSYTLRIVLEYGVVGLLLFYGVFAAAITYAARGALLAPRSERESSLFIPAGTALLCYLAIKSAFAQEDNQPFVFMLMGMVVALCYRLVGAPAATHEPQPVPASSQAPVRGERVLGGQDARLLPSARTLR